VDAGLKPSNVGTRFAATYGRHHHDRQPLADQISRAHSVLFTESVHDVQKSGQRLASMPEISQLMLKA
jgi:hypothetical protein